MLPLGNYSFTQEGSSRMSDENSRYLKRRRHRRAKIHKLLARLKNADARERVKLIDKLWKINPAVIPNEPAG